MKHLSFGLILVWLVFSQLCELTMADNVGFVFLRQGYGSRPAALGEAVTAAGGDLSSAGYNPSLLMRLSGNTQFSFAYNRIYEDVSQSNLSCGFKIGNYALAGLLNIGKVAGIERRGETASPDPLGKFEENNIVMSLQAAGTIRDLDYGLAIKYAYEKIDYSSAGALMFDFGLIFDIGYGVQVGAAAKNVGGKYRFEQASYPLPLEYRLGAAYSPPYLDHYRLSADIVVPRNTDTKTNFGLEWLPDDRYALRVGYGFGYDSRGVAFGGGLKYSLFAFDYAFVSNNNNLGGSHRLTVTVAP